MAGLLSFTFAQTNDDEDYEPASGDYDTSQESGDYSLPNSTEIPV